MLNRSAVSVSCSSPDRRTAARSAGAGSQLRSRPRFRGPLQLPFSLTRPHSRTVEQPQPQTRKGRPTLPDVLQPLLKGPQMPALYELIPRSDGLRSLIRGRRTALTGLHRPVGTIMFPAYVLGAVSSAVGVHATLPVLTGAAIGGLFACLNRFCSKRVWVRPRAPLNVVVTGGSKGLGKALAREFLREGDRVLITSRSQQGVDAALAELREELDNNLIQVFGVACDVADPTGIAQVEAAASSIFGNVHMWINNAGYSGSYQSFLDQNDDQTEQVIRTNLLGTMLCTRQAISLFKKQQNGGHLFNMDGAGADGFATPNYAAYGATKAGITQFTRTMQRELRDTKVKVHTVSPGMILTDLLLDGATTANKQAFNILCEQPETVAAFLVPRIKSAVARGRGGTYVRFLTPASALARFLTAPARVGRFFDANGKIVYPPEKERLLGRHAKVTARQQAAVRAQNGGLKLAYSLSVALSVLVMILEAPVLRG